MSNKVWSRYNKLFVKEGIYLFYNSLSNSFVELDKEYYELLLALKPGDEINLCDKDLISNLERMKAIVEDDSYEIKRIRFVNMARRFQKEVLTLTINPTFACNFSCPYCFENSHPTNRMSDDVAKGIIDFMLRQSPKRISVTWFGGEPLLEFDRIVSMTKEILNLDIPYRATIITNGYLLTEEKIKLLPTLKINRVQITLDGTKAIHDKRRFLKGGGGTFDRIYSNILKLAELSPSTEVGVRVNLDRTNLDSFIELYNLLGNQYKNIRVIPAFVNDVHKDGNLPCVLDLSEKFKYLKSLFREQGLVFDHFYPSYIRQECAVRNPMSMVIGPQGELYKCWNDVAQPDKIYGHISGEITNEKLLLEYLMDADPFENEDCRDCLLLPVCGGGCPYTRLLDKKKGTNSACPLNRFKIDEYLWEHYLSKRNRK